MTDRLVDTDAQAQFLAALLTDARHIDAHAVPPSTFGTLVHERVYDAIRMAHESGDGVSVGTVSEQLARAGHREPTRRDVSALVEQSAPWLDVAQLRARLTRLASMRRRRSELDLARAAIEREDVDAVVEHASAAAADVEVRTLEESDSHAVAIAAFTRLTKERPAPQPTLGISFLDETIGGFGAGELIIVAADTGVGKSATALTVAEHLAGRGMKLGYVSCEDPLSVVGNRLAARYSGMTAKQLREHRPTGQHLADLAAGIERARVRGVWPIAFVPGATDSDVVQAMTRLVRVGGAHMLCIDYVQTIECSRPSESRRNEIRAMASRFKATAARLGVPLMLMSQITVERGDGNKRPSKHDLRDSRDLAHVAELVLVLWRQRDEDFAPVEWAVVKGKQGGNGITGVLERLPGGLLRDASWTPRDQEERDAAE